MVSVTDPAETAAFSLSICNESAYSCVHTEMHRNNHIAHRDVSDAVSDLVTRRFSMCGAPDRTRGDSTPMWSWWPALVFGWPPLVLTLLLAVYGVARRRWVWLAVACVSALPISLYLMASPIYDWTGLALPVSVIGCGFAVHRRRTGIACLLLTPLFGISGWLAWEVVNQ